MQRYILFLFMVLTIHECVLQASARRRHHHHHHHQDTVSEENLSYDGRSATSTATTLPPPTDDDYGDAENVAPSKVFLKGIKGAVDTLSKLQKSQGKCEVGGAYGIKGECSKYVLCKKKNSIPATQFCPSGKFFDHLKRTCVKTSEAQCKDLCEKRPNGQRYADPTSDTGFLKCVKGVPFPETCKNGFIFSSSDRKCVKK